MEVSVWGGGILTGPYSVVLSAGRTFVGGRVRGRGGGVTAAGLRPGAP